MLFVLAERIGSVQFAVDEVASCLCRFVGRDASSVFIIIHVSVFILAVRMGIDGIERQFEIFVRVGHRTLDRGRKTTVPCRDGSAACFLESCIRIIDYHIDNSAR